jgi:hypothetical protein
MASGDMVAVEDLRVGDMILSPQTGGALRIASVIEGPEALPLVRIIAGDLSVRVTQTHIVLTQEGLKRAEDLSSDDSIVDEKGEYHAIDRLEPIPPEIGQRVINFVIEGFVPEVDKHLLVSDGIVTGDLYLQNNLESEQKNADAN